MREALLLAREAAADGEVPVGCVITLEDRIVGRGRNRREKGKTALAHAELEAIGEEPACVKNCPASCRIVGDLDDPGSNVSKALREAGDENVHSLPDVGNQPATRYILHKKTAKWRE